MTTTIEPPKGMFYDGVSAREHQVSITFWDNGLQISGPTLKKPVEWSYSDIRNVEDLANQTGTSFRVIDGSGRLLLFDGDLISKINDLSFNLTKSDISKSYWKRIGLWGTGAIVSVVMIIFVIIPSLANQLATLIPVEREIALGKGSLKQIERFIGYGNERTLICSEKKGQAALDKMVSRLEKHLDSPYPLDIKVYNHDMPNAFAVPGGHIVLFDGLIKEASSPEEVAGVLGHEMGHVIHRDPTRLTLRSAGSVGILGMVFGDFAGGAVALIVAEQLIAANYSQDAETKADTFSHNLLAAAELPSTPMAAFFDRLHDEFGDEPDFLSHIASHPDLLGRSKAAKDADTVGKKPFEAILTTAEWEDLKSICPARLKNTKTEKGILSKDE